MPFKGAGLNVLAVSRGAYPELDDALKKLQLEGLLGEAKRVSVPASGDPLGAWANIVKKVRDEQIEIVVLHHYHSRDIPDLTNAIRSIRTLDHRPVVAFTSGDAFYNGFFQPSHSAVFKSTSAAVDLVLSTSMGTTADAIVGYGAERVALFPHAACPVRFPKQDEPHRPSESEFDVCFIGSNNRPRNPSRSYFWYGLKRERLIRHLSRKFGERFALFGTGWEGISSNRGPIAYAEQMQACRSARVVVGGVPYSPARYYTSDRPFNQIMSGVPFVDLAVEGVETILRDGEHWQLSDSIAGVADRVDDLLCLPDSVRIEMGEAAASFVAENHTQVDRLRWLFRTLDSLRHSILAETRPSMPSLDFLLPEARTPRQAELATRGWL